MKKTLLSVVMVALALVLFSTPAIAGGGEDDIALVYLGAALEETGAGHEEVVDAASELDYDHVVYAVEVEMFLEGFTEEVRDLDDNDLTDQMAELADDAEDVEELAELGAVSDETETVIENVQ